ncbi:hypothetical protein GSI_02813 [Ganoderma sinense ZZ0214-1]|uniref:Uncharacterized protein n=1 Tax=Ganoderma sinense ZZ0214-1 TaxID=1077348 RepID=A0A2G8SMN2_9APHY|nr:hypothetical protein GSI_02813 [Ganoderma sinense ZZ0214-1]
MPKDTRKSLTSRSHLRSAQVTTGPGGADTVEEPQASGGSGPIDLVQPQPQWRASKVREDSKLAKILALQQYRLKQEDIKSLPFEKRSTVVAGKKRDMYLYKERDVERKAWERYGGPEGFEAYLKILHDKHVEAKGTRAPFVRPSSYKISGSNVPAASQSARASATKTAKPKASGASLTVDKAATDAELARIKQSMQPWLWDACIHALDADIEPTDFVMADGRLLRRVRDRLGPMKDALETTKTYPVCPAQALPPSASVDKLRAVLAASPCLPGELDFGADVERLTYCTCYVPYEIEWYEWSAEYLERLFAAILEVVEENGLGETGWATVRWEIYDKYAKTFGEGIKYHRDGMIWGDKGAEWLDGQLAGRAHELSCRAKCASGLKFNEALPAESVEGYRCVGDGLYA